MASKPAFAAAAEVAPGRRLRPLTSLDARFRGYGDRAGAFARSIQTLTAFHGNLDCLQAEPNLRIVRTSFGKWSVEILDLLHPRRRASFGELRRLLDGISPRVLSAKLKLLEEHGLVDRTIVPSRPPRPEYSLTEAGRAVTTIGAPVLRYLKGRMANGSRAARRRR